MSIILWFVLFDKVMFLNFQYSETDAERKEVLEKYLSKQPEPLNRQFLERKSKEEAVKDYRARQQMRKTSLVPSG